jgi:3-oxoacyl-[acyl-carrier-protein] synthase II
MGDIIESQAIEAVYGRGPHVTGLKSYTGHTMGTCGAMELIMTLYMMADGFLAPTLNLEEVDPRCAMLKHTPGVIEAVTRIASIQNFAFGGVNTCLLIRNGHEVE